MRVIPVIDLLNGDVVRGIAGRREAYRPIDSLIAADCRPETIARTFANDFRFDTVYVADLDAIQHGRPNVTAWQQIAEAGLKLWLDAGIGDAAAAASFLDVVTRANIDARLVVGLESLVSAAELTAIREICHGQTPIFSLDLKAGRLITRIPDWQCLSPLEIAQRAFVAEYRDLIVLDLANVGANSGTHTLDLCRKIRDAAATPLNLIAGGGVRSLADLQALESAGCDAVLVASALHDKRLTPEDIRPFTN